eukprot:TRINITY_DN28528_c0_g1_i2.p2 TRINITY_DN28528_c0_g1~~TRINITY_DN28528_c0_g1_i2.p2  ORF type:complete len:261 (+),score=52.11 TRINITY_DN28528_c0_g1_i2:277-1059(+)
MQMTQARSIGLLLVLRGDLARAAGSLQDALRAAGVAEPQPGWSEPLPTGDGGCRAEHWRHACEQRCRAIDAWLSMGTELAYGPSQDDLVLYGRVQLWYRCPITYFGVSMQLARSQLLQGGIESLRSVEALVRSLFDVMGMNLTIYFDPMYLSRAPFYHLQRYVAALSSHVGQLGVPGDAQKNSPKTQVFQEMMEALGCSWASESDEFTSPQEAASFALRQLELAEGGALPAGGHTTQSHHRRPELQQCGLSALTQMLVAS